MRPIEFRAWDKENNRVVYGISLSTQDGELFPISSNWDDVINITECELMQFIGFLDKNGKKIFEGDIVKNYACKRMQYGNIGLISFYEGSFVIEFKNTIKIYIGDCEIIGNIYENPDLIGGKDERE